MPVRTRIFSCGEPRKVATKESTVKDKQQESQLSLLNTSSTQKSVEHDSTIAPLTPSNKAMPSFRPRNMSIQSVGLSIKRALSLHTSTSSMPASDGVAMLDASAGDRAYADVYSRDGSVSESYADEIKDSKELWFRYQCFRLAVHPKFELSIMICIILNVILMAMSYHGQDPMYFDMLERISNVFTGIFISEMVLKWCGLGLGQYFEDRWNTFDSIIVLTSIVSLIVESLGESIGIDPSVFRIFRIFRILRVLRLVKKATGIRQLIQTLVFSFPMLVNVGTLLVLLLFMFAIIGMNLFGRIKYGKYLNEHANFRDLPTSMITLFRMSTGESWNGLMRECMNTRNCIEDECGQPVQAVIFFTLFQVLSNFLMLNVFVAVVLKNFEEEVGLDPTTSTNPVSRAVIQKFGQTWSQYSGSHSLPIRKLKDFLADLYPPLGPPLAQLRPGPYLSLLNRLQLPSYKEHVHWLDLCAALTAQVFFNATPQLHHGVPESNELLMGIKIQIYAQYPELKRTRHYRISVADVAACIALQRAWRRRQYEKALRKAGGNPRKRMISQAILVGAAKHRGSVEHTSQEPRKESSSQGRRFSVHRSQKRPHGLEIVGLIREEPSKLEPSMLAVEQAEENPRFSAAVVRDNEGARSVAATNMALA